MRDGQELSVLLNGFLCKEDDCEVSFVSVYVFYLFKSCEEVSRIYFVLTTV